MDIQNNDAGIVLPKPAQAHARRVVPFRTRGLTVRPAGNLPDLEASLALERRSLKGDMPGSLGEPTAVPFCDFLMALDPDDILAGVCRLMLHSPWSLRHSLPGTPRGGQAVASFPAPAPLLTAMRYSSSRVLEVGMLALHPLGDSPSVCAALWDGIVARMADPGIGFAMGVERAAPQGIDLPEKLAYLQEAHGLHPDLEAAAPPTAWTGGRQEWLGLEREGKPDWLPAGLREALRRGCRLLGHPQANSANGILEFPWVASREMLLVEPL